MQHFLNWLKSKFSPDKDTPRRKLRRAGSDPDQSKTQDHRILATRGPTIARSQPEPVDDASGPGKNVLMGNQDVGEDEDTGDTHELETVELETLELDDDLSIESDDGTGLDPYNTGQFDPSKTWDKLFRK